MYSLRTSTVLIGMIFTGAGRSVGVKVVYQLGYGDPLMVVLLYLAGQSLSLVVYWVTRCCGNNYCCSQEGTAEYELLHHDGQQDQEGSEEKDNSSECITVIDAPSSLAIANGDSEHSSSADIATERCDDESDDDDATELTMAEALEEEEDTDEEASVIVHPSSSSTTTPRPQTRRKRRGSGHGLSNNSIEAVSWVHRIPWYLKPTVSGFFNLCNAALRWATYVYVPASVADMLISGSELILSVIAARLIRKRMVSYNRWCGVGIVSVGLLLIGFTTHVLMSDDNGGSDDDGARSSHWIGNVLVLGQSIMSVLQDISEELFLQEADFPPTLLLGLEGLYGLLFGTILYLSVSFFTGHDIHNLDSFAKISQTNTMVIGLIMVLWFLITGIFNILMTEATSSMTRNVWKNVRILVVWTLGLLLFFCTTGSSTTETIGEDWKTPQSYIILLGYLIMLLGIYAYYR